MKAAALPLVLLTALLMGANSAAAEELAAQDKMFLDKAASDGLAEVELGQLAQQKAVSPEVKQFGQRMVQDHEQAGAGDQTPDRAAGQRDAGHPAPPREGIAEHVRGAAREAGFDPLETEH